MSNLLGGFAFVVLWQVHVLAVIAVRAGFGEISDETDPSPLSRTASEEERDPRPPLRGSQPPRSLIT